MRNIATIDLRTLCNNADEIKRRLPKGVKFCAVVKADAYGHGACECAAALYKTVDCYAVALVEEGIALRLSGIDKEVLVLIPAAKEDVAPAVEYGLTLTVASVSDISALEREGKRQKADDRVPVPLGAVLSVRAQLHRGGEARRGILHQGSLHPPPGRADLGRLYGRGEAGRGTDDRHRDPFHRRRAVRGDEDDGPGVGAEAQAEGGQ